jgi:hypothetical protein
MSLAGLDKDDSAELALGNFRLFAPSLNLPLDLSARRQQRLPHELREAELEPAGRRDHLRPFSVREPCTQNCRLHC